MIRLSPRDSEVSLPASLKPQATERAPLSHVRWPSRLSAWKGLVSFDRMRNHASHVLCWPSTQMADGSAEPKKIRHGAVARGLTQHAGLGTSVAKKPAADISHVHYASNTCAPLRKCRKWVVLFSTTRSSKFRGRRAATGVAVPKSLGIPPICLERLVYKRSGSFAGMSTWLLR